MKKVWKKTISLTLAFVILFTGMLFAPQTASTAEAASAYYLPSAYQNMVFYCVPDDLPATYVTLKVYKKGTYKKPKASYIHSLSSSDPSIARPYIDKSGDIRVYFFKKPGTAAISFQIGKQTLTSTITVKKYSNPFSRFKVGKKDFTTRFRSSTECNYFHTADLKNQAVSLKAAKGWKISSLRIQYGTASYVINSCRKLSFSKKFTFDGAADYISVTMYHGKTKSYITLDGNCMKE